MKATSLSPKQERKLRMNNNSAGLDVGMKKVELSKNSYFGKNTLKLL